MLFSPGGFTAARLDVLGLTAGPGSLLGFNDRCDITVGPGEPSQVILGEEA